MTQYDLTIAEAEQILLLTEPYDLDDLSKCYRARAKKAHPDLGGTEDEMLQVNQAYECLKMLFDDTNAKTKRDPIKTSEYASSGSSSPGNGQSWNGTGTSSGMTSDVADGISFEDFMDFISAYERIKREEERRKAEEESAWKNSEKGDMPFGQTAVQGAAGREEYGESSKEKEISDSLDSENTPTKFRYKLSKFFAGLCHLPYGIAAFLFFEWQALSTQRTMDSMFGGVGMLVDIAFETIILAPILALIVRSIIRAILGAIAKALAK